MATISRISSVVMAFSGGRPLYTGGSADTFLA
jgi:hypothetical protein